MSVVERIVAEAREAKRRKDAAVAAVLALPVDHQREVLAELIQHVEAQEAAKPATNGPDESAPKNGASNQAGHPNWKSGTYTERADAFVLAHPEGVKTRDVAEAIGQDVSGVDGTLRILLKKGRVRRDGRLWLPPLPTPHGSNGAAGTNGSASRPRRVTIREKIEQVYQVNRNTPIGASALFDALKLIDTAINRSSVDGEINRMKAADLLVQVGTGPHGGGLYKLKEVVTPK